MRRAAGWTGWHHQHLAARTPIRLGLWVPHHGGRQIARFEHDGRRPVRRRAAGLGLVATSNNGVMRDDPVGEEVVGLLDLEVVDALVANLFDGNDGIPEDSWGLRAIDSRR